MDLVAEANAASVCPFTADDRAGLPGWQKQPAFPIPGLGGGAKKRLTEYDRADVVVGIRFHKHSDSQKPLGVVWILTVYCRPVFTARAS